MSLEKQITNSDQNELEENNTDIVALNKLQIHLMIDMLGGKDKAKDHASEWIKDHGLSFRVVANTWQEVHPDKPLTLEQDSLDQIESDLKVVEGLEQQLNDSMTSTTKLEVGTIRESWEEKFGSTFQQFLTDHPEFLVQYRNGNKFTKQQIVEDIKRHLNF